MRTSKPISTISYNTEDFLKAKLAELLRNHKIDDYMYIRHDAEQDEKKDHIHLWLSPNRLLDTMDLQDFFKEYDPKNPQKLLKCLPFSVSKQDDWILYGMHLPAYLATKGESREFIYTKDDFRYADEDAFERAYIHALKGSEWAQRNMTLQLLADGTVNPAELILSGVIPLNMANQVSALASLQDRTLRRNGRPNHEIKDDPPEAKEQLERVENRRKSKAKKKAQEQLELQLQQENPFQT